MKVDGRTVTVTAKTLPVEPDEKVADALAKYAGTDSRTT